MLLVGFIGLQNSLDDGESIRGIGTVRIPKIENLLYIEVDIAELLRREHEIADRGLLPYEQQIAEVRLVAGKLEHALEIIGKRIAEYEAMPRNAVAQKAWEEFTSTWTRFSVSDRDFLERAKTAAASPSPERLSALYQHVVDVNMQRRELTEKLDAVVRSLTGMNTKIVVEEIQDVERTSRNAVILQCVAIAVMVLLLIGLLISLNFSVIKPVEHTRNLIVQVEQEQDLRLRTDHISSDEIGQMSGAFDAMLGKLQKSLQNIQDKMHEVSRAVSEVNGAAQEVASGSASQSSSTSAMAAAVEEMTVSISTVSNSAVEAQNIANEAGEIANQGGAIIDQTVTEMGHIAATVSQASHAIEALGKESQQISSVVQVIKEVADQTNLLALNAAIEAARAGEQGRGFAVVADEVRKLAERTSQSTSDISAMVGKIQSSANDAVAEMSRVVQQVESGQTLAQDAGKRISSIRESSNKVAHAVAEISDALKEQSGASQDIARNVESVAQMTDQNNAAAGSVANGVERLDQLTRDVNDTVEQFKV
jgi:methyl-accepting chemotaxis protein